MPSPPDLALRPPVTEPIDGALTFLLGQQDARGAWRDFFLPAGESDGWVTAYVGLALAESGDVRGHAAAMAAWRHLETALKPEGGWGYNAVTPPDADSTLWALRLAHALGESDSAPARRGRAFLDGHRRDTSGIATYASADGPRGYVGLPTSVDFSAWTHPHVCVSAAAAGLPGMLDKGLRGFLLSAQNADGVWPSYWWFDPGYATAEAVEALGAGPPARRAARYAETLVAAWTDGDTPVPAFGVAHALRTMLVDAHAESAAAIERAGDLLRTSQTANGSWPASARLRVPAPDCFAPDPAARWKPWHGLGAMPGSLAALLDMTFTITSLDHRRAFTTATVLRALTALSAA